MENWPSEADISFPYNTITAKTGPALEKKKHFPLA